MEQTISNGNGGTGIYGDNFRDFKKYLEIEKMNRFNNNINNNDNGSTNTNYDNTNTFNTSNYSSFKASTNRTPFQYTPLKRAINENSIRPLSVNQNFNSVNNNNNLLDNNNNNIISLNNNLSSQISDLISEINSLKSFVSKSKSEQNELSQKIIDYNNIITEQEKIIRINNLKLNEHDNKLSEILLSFNNYLNLNSKTSTIVNEVNKKLENCVKNTEHNDLKSTVYSLNKENEQKINENINSINDINIKLNEMQKSNEIFQKFSLDKISQVQKENSNNVLQNQNDLIKMEESKEVRINTQLAQMKNLINNNNDNIKEESEFRKKMINELRNEFLEIFSKFETKINSIEKNTLESEKNLINMNKDSISSINDIINHNNDKNSFELKSIKSLLEGSLIKIDSTLNKERKVNEENFTNIKKNLIEDKNNINNIESSVKDNINNIENKIVNLNKLNNDYFSKFDILNEDYNKNKKNTLELILNKETEIKEIFNKNLNDNVYNLQENINNNNESYLKKFVDLNDKIKDLQKIVEKIIVNNVNQNDINNINNNNFTDPNTTLLREYIEKIVNENILPFKEIINNFKLMLTQTLQKEIEEIKNKIKIDDEEKMKKINEMIDNRIKINNNDIDNKIKEKNIILDGRLQEYVVESENRIKNKYDNEFKKVSDDIKDIINKIEKVEN